MPKKTYAKKKKTYRRKAKARGGPSTTVSLRSSPIADRTIVKLKYVENFTFASGVGVATNYTFRANDAYDPNYTGTGHQPMGFDQYATFYHKIIVLGSRIKLTVWSNGSAASTDAGMCGVVLQNEPPSVTNIETLRERNMGKFKPLANSAGGNNIKTISCNYSAVKHFGIKKNEVEDDQYSHSFTSSPARHAYFAAYWLPLATSITHNAIYGTAEISYICCLFDRNDLSGS